MNLVFELHKDERGFIVTIELLLIVTIVVIGLVAGLSVLREAVVTELNELSESISEINEDAGLATPPIEPVMMSETTDSTEKRVNNCVEVYSSFGDF